MSECWIDWEITEVCEKCGKEQDSIVKILDGEINEYSDKGTTEECWECECKRIRKERKARDKLALETRRAECKRALYV